MTVFVTHKFKGREYVPLEDAIELDRTATKAKKDNSLWSASTYRAKVTETYTGDEGGTLVHSESSFETSDLELAQHWIRDKKIELDASGFRVASFLYEVKDRRLSDDGTVRKPYYSFGLSSNLW